ncbi:hypothetical protein [Methanobrevibacter sp.]|uniref:hypothetical protein n=1 Tax=Methanobrevibacter sp. TaxID=66852 RepID=UPI00262CDE23|nr:hypothetical protein [uncultured Methanobrevibacter sp.]
MNNYPAKNVEIDFNNLVFMSQSFTQEYIYQKKNDTNKSIKEVNIPKDIKTMFEIVKKDFDNL